MSDRIQQLEDALALLQSSFSTEGHPLLRSDLLRIKSSAELHRAQMPSSTLPLSPAIDEHQEYDLNVSQSSSMTGQPSHDSVHVSNGHIQPYVNHKLSAVYRKVLRSNMTPVLDIRSSRPTYLH